MRCNVCKYKQGYAGEGSSYYEEDSCTLCFLTDYSEQTENSKGEIGCRLNQRTLDYRYRMMQECNHTRLPKNKDSRLFLG